MDRSGPNRYLSYTMGLLFLVGSGAHGHHLLGSVSSNAVKTTAHSNHGNSECFLFGASMARDYLQEDVLRSQLITAAEGRLHEGNHQPEEVLRGCTTSRTYWPRLCSCLSEPGRFCSSLLQVRSWFRPDTKNLTTRFTPTPALGQAAAALSWSSSLDRQTRCALVLATLLHRLRAGTMQPTGLANAAFLLYASAPWSVAASADSLSKAQSLRLRPVGQGAVLRN